MGLKKRALNQTTDTAFKLPNDIYCELKILSMKKLLIILLLSPLAQSEDLNLYTKFDGTTYLDLVEKIQATKEKKPVKDKWMKESEYQALYTNYMNEYDSEIYFKISLGDIKVPCSMASKRASFCYDVEQELIILRANYGYSDSHKSYFNKRESYDNYSAQTAIQKNIGTSTRVSSRTTFYDVIFLENLQSKSAFSNLPFVELPVPIDEMKADEKNYSAYLVFSVSLLNDKHYLNGNGRLTYNKEPTLNVPTQRMEYERQIYATHRGILLEKSGKVILNSTPKQELKIKRMPNDYVPLFRIQPLYPRRAQERGTEGYVVVKFTITESGSVENVVPVEGYCGDPSGPQEVMRPCSIFNSASVRAAQKLKYKPRMVDGKPVRVDDVNHKFTFMLADD